MRLGRVFAYRLLLVQTIGIFYPLLAEGISFHRHSRKNVPFLHRKAMSSFVLSRMLYRFHFPPRYPY
jgi:hypothetical protein